MAVVTNAKFKGRSLTVLRYLDVAVVVIAVGPALAYGAPVLGTVAGALGWVFQRVVAEFDRRWTRRVTEPVRQLGVTLFEGFARIWLLAIVIVVVAIIGGRRDGLTASLMIFGAYSVAFAVKLLTGPRRRSAQ